MAPYRTPDWFSWDESADRYPNTRIHQARAAIFAPELGDVVPFNLSVGIFSHTISSHACVYTYIYNLVLCIYHIYIYISISHWICWQETAMILPIRFFTPRPQKKSHKVPAPVCPVWTPTSCRSCSRGTTCCGYFFWRSIMETEWGYHGIYPLVI